MGRKRQPKHTWRGQIEQHKREFREMTVDEIVGFRRAFWPGGSGMSNSVRCSLIALLEVVAEERGIELPEYMPEGYAS
jgi:hypothetical protein